MELLINQEKLVVVYLEYLLLKVMVLVVKVELKLLPEKEVHSVKVD